MRLFQAALDTCLDSPFFASLSVHGLHFTVYAPSKKILPWGWPQSPFKNSKNTQRALRDILMSRGQKLSPHCLETSFDSQLPSPKSSPKMPPKLFLPHRRGHFFLFQNYPCGEGNREAIERQKLSRGKNDIKMSRRAHWVLEKARKCIFLSIFRRFSVFFWVFKGPRGPNDQKKIQPRSKFPISIEIFNLARECQSRRLEFPTKSRATVGGSLENFILTRNFQSRSKSRFFSSLGPLGNLGSSPREEFSVSSRSFGALNPCSWSGVSQVLEAQRSREHWPCCAMCVGVLLGHRGPMNYDAH